MSQKYDKGQIVAWYDRNGLIQVWARARGKTDLVLTPEAAESLAKQLSEAARIARLKATVKVARRKAK